MFPHYRLEGLEGWGFGDILWLNWSASHSHKDDYLVHAFYLLLGTHSESNHQWLCLDVKGFWHHFIPMNSLCHEVILPSFIMHLLISFCIFSPWLIFSPVPYCSEWLRVLISQLLLSHIPDMQFLPPLDQDFSAFALLTFLVRLFSLWEAILCVLGCLGASLDLTYQVLLIAALFPGDNNPKCLCMRAKLLS